MRYRVCGGMLCTAQDTQCRPPAPAQPCCLRGRARPLSTPTMPWGSSPHCHLWAPGSSAALDCGPQGALRRDQAGAHALADGVCQRLALGQLGHPQLLERAQKGRTVRQAERDAAVQGGGAAQQPGGGRPDSDRRQKDAKVGGGGRAGDTGGGMLPTGLPVAVRVALAFECLAVVLVGVEDHLAPLRAQPRPGRPRRRVAVHTPMKPGRCQIGRLRRPLTARQPA
mmetsp:Transcript_35229/g.113485  ORF Transcript_35229/g.113485 Transcript_35229/m.113485 type:complete len:225 (+) Transcript_35229:108-782(+)